MIKIFQHLIEEVLAHARRELPNECCGLLGGSEDFIRTVYELKNIAGNPLVEYEAAPEDLLAAQTLMRERGESLIAIYHSHPRQPAPVPSQTDVERAFYAEAIYFIVGFKDEKPVLRAFRIYEKRRVWERAEFFVIN